MDDLKEKVSVGDIRTGRELGKGAEEDGYTKFRWCQCLSCQKERWVTLYLYKKNGDTLCKECSGRKNGKINSKKWTNRVQ
jgi:hypothetical protein